MHFEVLGANIPRVSPSVKQELIDSGLIWYDENGEPHTREEHEKSTTRADQSN